MSLSDVACAQEEIIHIIGQYAKFSAADPCISLKEETNSLSDAKHETLCSGSEETDIESFLKSIDRSLEARNELRENDLSLYQSHLQFISSSILPSKNDEQNLFVAKVCEHIDVILKNKSLISWCLQQSTISNSLNIHYSYHEALRKSLQNIIDIMVNLGKYIKCLQQDHSTLIERNEKNIRKLMDLSNTVQTLVNNANKIEECIRQ